MSTEITKIFWEMRTFVMIRDPDLLEEFMEFFHKPLQELGEWLDKNYPLTDGVLWGSKSIFDANDILRKEYPYGRKYAVNRSSGTETS